MARPSEENEKRLKDRLTAKIILTSEESALLERLNGKQPTLEICGQIFFVNWMQQRLEKKGEPTEGITFDELEDFYVNNGSKCILPYDTQSQGILDYANLIEMPENVVFVEIPSPERLDLVGSSRKSGEALDELLKKTSQQQQHNAKIVTPKNAWLRYVVASNRRDRGLEPLKHKKGIRRSPR